MSSETLLEVQGLCKRYGGVIAIDELSFVLPAGSITGVIGPNGAGKSTLIGLLGGALTASAGSIHLAGRNITRLAAAERARLGIGRTYQIPRPFLDMSVDDNLAVAQLASRQRRHGALARARRGELLETCGLSDMRALPARQLPLLRRKRLEVARALALEPRLLLLDEVGAGLIDSEVSELIALVHAVGASGTTIVIVEHVLRIVRECCSRLLVLNFGRELAAGAPAQILASDAVASVYLGTAHARAGDGTAAVASEQAAGLATLIDVPAAPPASAAPLLRLAGVDVSYGQVPALRDVSLEVRAGEVVAVLGANGAGKTTLAQLISGTLRAQRGSVEIDGVPVANARADQVAARGIAHCMEGRRIFAELSVEQNLMIAARGCSRPQVARRVAAVYALFPVLAERRSDPGTAMSGGQQQMLAIGRTLMARPRLAVFDEISLGLAPIVIDRLYESLAALKRAGLAMLIVEQDVDRALALADRTLVLEHGVLAFEGPAAEVRSDARLRRLYLGEAD